MCWRSSRASRCTTAAACRRPPPRVLAAYVLPLLPWLIFAWLYFGNVLPQSMLAKHQHAMTADRWWMLAFCGGPEVLPFWPLAISGLLLPLVRRTGAPAGLQALAIWAVAYTAAYSLYRIDLYQWYLSPLTVALGVGCNAVAMLVLFLYLTNEAMPAGFYRQPYWLWGAAFVVFLWSLRIWGLSHRGKLNADPVAFAIRDRTSIALGLVVAAIFAIAI